MTPGRPLTLLAAALGAAVLLGCGGDDGSGDEPGPAAGSADAVAPEEDRAAQGSGVLSGSLPLLDGTEQNLADYRGKVVLAVNTASECGFAPQFEGLEDLYRERRDDGLVILGFPADDVVGQEPRSDEEIAEYCRANFGVTFPMFAKSNVVDDPVNPLFVKLAEELGAPNYNFNKYLIDREGRPVDRFDAPVEPDSPELTEAIEAELSR